MVGAGGDLGHRTGRPGRATSAGVGLAVLAPFRIKLWSLTWPSTACR